MNASVYAYLAGPLCGRCRAFGPVIPDRLWVLEPVLGCVPEWPGHIAQAEDVTDIVLGTVLYEAASLASPDEHGAVVHRELLGVYVPDHATATYYFIDLRSPEVVQYGLPRVHRYLALALFLLKAVALQMRDLPHAGAPDDCTGLMIERFFSDDPVLSVWVQQFRERRSEMHRRRTEDE